MTTKKNTLHVAVDIDDKSYHGSALCLSTGEVFNFKTKPTFGALKRSLTRLQNKGFVLDVCYEATYIGFNLCRDLRRYKINCNVIAPSLIPSKKGKCIKNDRVDSINLAEYYAKNLLTAVNIPDEEDERVRDLIRARSFVIGQRKKLKSHIIAYCRRNKMNYREETKYKEYWTISHIEWLEIKIKQLKSISKTTLTTLLYQYDKCNESINELEREINSISNTRRYKKRKNALNCFRGLDTLSSMTILSEIGDIRRFAHPKFLTSFAGLDIREYSSGGKERKFGITKMGNKHIRTTIIEACQIDLTHYCLSKRLKKAREGQSLKVIDVADRCMKRLKKKANKMMYRGKHINKIKTACAREMLSFIWEALVLVG